MTFFKDKVKRQQNSSLFSQSAPLYHSVLKFDTEDAAVTTHHNVNTDEANLDHKFCQEMFTYETGSPILPTHNSFDFSQVPKLMLTPSNDLIPPKRCHTRSHSEDTRSLTVLQALKASSPFYGTNGRNNDEQWRTPKKKLLDVEHGVSDDSVDHNVPYIHPLGKRVRSAPELISLSTLLTRQGMEGFGTPRGILCTVAVVLLANCLWRFEQREEQGILIWGIWPVIQLISPLIALSWGLWTSTYLRKDRDRARE